MPSVPPIILTNEQRAMRAYAARHTTQGQTMAATRRIEHGLDGLAAELQAEGGQLTVQAVTNGLLNNLVHQLATLPDGERQAFVHNVCHALPGRVEARLPAMQQEQD